MTGLNVAVITLFPEMFTAFGLHGMVGRALMKKQLVLSLINPRAFATDRHRTVDAPPYGGGRGMVMMVPPLRAALQSAKQRLPADTKIFHLTPAGIPLTHERVLQLSRDDGFILLCGHYEGIDERLLLSEVDAEYSIGDYVLSGGELAAMVLIDAVMRQRPGVLPVQSIQEESFATGLLEAPHYTRPYALPEGEVPPVLRSGNHQAIQVWRLKQALGRTWLRRPDLLSNRRLTQQEQLLLDEFKREV